MKAILIIVITIFSNLSFTLAQIFYPSQIESITGYSNLSNNSDFVKQFYNFSDKNYKLSLCYNPSRFEIKDLDYISFHFSKTIDSSKAISLLMSSLNNSLYTSSEIGLKFSYNLEQLILNSGLIYSINHVQNYKDIYNINFFCGTGMNLNSGIRVAMLYRNIKLIGNNEINYYQLINIGAGYKISDDLYSDLGFDFGNSLFKNYHLAIAYQILSEIKGKIAYNYSPNAIEIGINLKYSDFGSINFSIIYLQYIDFNRTIGTDLYFK